MVKKRRKWRFSNSPNSLIIMVLSVSALVMLWIGGGPFLNPREADDSVLKSGLNSEEIRRAGHRLYNAQCLNCHGVNGRGTSFGPPLVHGLYERSKLPDRAFLQAIFYGTPQKHWSYGPMEPLEGISQVEAAQILAYIRTRQDALKNR
ncbi:c-type cytochrome [Cohaesibacter intestini]|uniref:c-type cytochrome n=1 Tax=Cohaesibacter intestini TaxID=2211145 RepID=UPI000DE90C94|nr:cytochrome c [Cohaesibacter intestini]